MRYFFILAVDHSRFYYLSSATCFGLLRRTIRQTII